MLMNYQHYESKTFDFWAMFNWVISLKSVHRFDLSNLTELGIFLS